MPNLGVERDRKTGQLTLAIRVTGLGMTRSQGIELTEGLEIIHRKLVAKEMQENILQCATVYDELRGIGRSH